MTTLPIIWAEMAQTSGAEEHCLSCLEDHYTDRSFSGVAAPAVLSFIILQSVPVKPISVHTPTTFCLFCCHFVLSTNVQALMIYLSVCPLF